MQTRVHALCSLPLVPRPGPDGRWLDKDIGRYAKQSDRDTNTSGKHCHNSFPRLITRLEINIGNNKHSFIPNHGDKHRITAASEESLHQINRGGGCELGVNIYAPSKYRRVKLPTHSWGYFGLNFSKMTRICLRSDNMWWQFICIGTFLRASNFRTFYFEVTS